MSFNTYVHNSLVFVSTTSGIYAYNEDDLSLVNYMYFPGTTSVYIDDSYIYLGTSLSGVVRRTLNTVSGSGTFYNYKNVPNITSNEVHYVHGSGNYICAATESGVDSYVISSGNRRYVTVSGVSKCFQTDDGDFYYTTYTQDGLSAWYETASGIGYVYDETNIFFSGCYY
jgi:hypothetical protein